jgi:hypothetical protein
VLDDQLGELMSLIKATCTIHLWIPLLLPYSEAGTVPGWQCHNNFKLTQCVIERYP